MSSPVYLDYNATTPVAPEVCDAMLPWLVARHGNPSSSHSFGRAAREAVESSRAVIAESIGGRPEELVFCASGTEANNAVLFSSFGARAGSVSEPSGHLIVSAVEHPSILATADLLETRGVSVTRLGVDSQGLLAVDELLQALRPETRLVCVMLANNEVGTIQPLAEIAAACRERGVLTLCDAVQAMGKIPVDAAELGVDFLTIGAHKFYGPLGVAALRIRTGVAFEPYLIGGSHERRRRAGTENVAAIVGTARAAELVGDRLNTDAVRMAEVRDRLETRLAAVADVVLHATEVERLPNTSNPAFLGTRSDELMMRLDLRGFAVSTGSACASGKVEVSGTLGAMGIAAQEALASLRISVGRYTTDDELERFLVAVTEEVAELRSLSRTAAVSKEAAVSTDAGASKARSA